MMKGNGYLVVGGDSLVGGGLLRALEGRGHAVLASTRRRDTLAERRVLLDFESDVPFRMPAGIDYAFVVAAATNYDRCERDPLAHQINVVLTPRLVASLLEQRVFVTFISTNSVFGGERPWPHEEDPHLPGIAYAKQKAEAEKTIRAEARRLGAEDRLNIVRLTKILDVDTPPLPNWFSAWGRGETIQPFSDLTFAPMSVRFVGNALATIGEKRISGDLHLSGAQNVSYVDLATELAGRLGIEAHLIAPTTAEEKGVNIPFKPRFSGLGMRRTTELSGVTPQTIAEVAKDLAAQHIARTSIETRRDE
jgi:dTDP-4-dehydrorhamnose reductase